MLNARGVKRAAQSATTHVAENAPSTKKRKVVGESKANMSTSKSEDPLPSQSEGDREARKAQIDTLEQDTMGKSWFDALQPEFKKPYFAQLKKFLASEHASHTVYPSIENVYSWSRLTSLDSVKVVVLGQDPYHNIGQAHGLSFSVLPPTKLPPSLKNIYKQIATDVPSFKMPKSGDLSPLAKEGVLWLNACLTVRAHNANSHSKKGWETFTAEVVRSVTSRENGRGVVFFAWGSPAQKTCDSIGIDETKHLVLRSAHPSPLSAHRGFLGNGHFAKANEWLREKYGDGEEINWAALK